MRWAIFKYACGKAKLRPGPDQMPAKTRLDVPQIQFDDQAARRSYFANVEPPASY
jgi:hypothetical protein